MAFDPSSLEALSAPELVQRRTEIVAQMAALPNSYQDAPTETLQELAFITGALRRRTSGPPRETKARAVKHPGAGAPAASVDDLADMF